LIAFN
jgi:hypothetical protein